MKLKLKKLGHGLSDTLLIWEQDGTKKVAKVTLGQTFDVEDKAGHILLGQHSEMLELVSYGNSEPQKRRSGSINVKEKTKAPTPAVVAETPGV